MPRSFPLLATPTPHVNVVLYPEHSFPMSMHCVQYGRLRSHLTARLEQVKQSSVAPPAAVRRLLFLGGCAAMGSGCCCCCTGGSAGVSTADVILDRAEVGAANAIVGGRFSAWSDERQEAVPNSEYPGRWQVCGQEEAWMGSRVSSQASCSHPTHRYKKPLSRLILRYVRPALNSRLDKGAISAA